MRSLSDTLSLLPDDIIRELYETLADIDIPRRASYRKLSAYSHSARNSDEGSLGWIKMTHVSRRLRNIGINLSSIWGRVVCVFPRAWETTLARSRNAPLDLHLSDDGLEAYSHWPLSADVLLARARYISDVVSPGQSATRSWWANTSHASLKVLELTVNDYTKAFDRDPGLLLKMGLITAPALEAYTVFGGYIPFHAPLASKPYSLAPSCMDDNRSRLADLPSS